MDFIELWKDGDTIQGGTLLQIPDLARYVLRLHSIIQAPGTAEKGQRPHFFSMVAAPHRAPGFNRVG